jgi:hypothetical protein
MQAQNQETQAGHPPPGPSIELTDTILGGKKNTRLISYYFDRTHDVTSSCECHSNRKVRKGPLNFVE